MKIPTAKTHASSTSAILAFITDTSAVVHWWKHRFTSECMNLVYDQAFGAKTPTYSTVLQLDRKLRGFTVPASLQIAGFGNSESRVGTYNESVPLILQRHLVLAIRESSE